jgi:hypothetical protein
LEYVQLENISMLAKIGGNQKNANRRLMLE